MSTQHIATRGRRRRLLAGVLPVALATPLLLAAPVQAAAGSRSCGWTLMPSRSPGSVRNFLFAAAADPGRTDRLWAVGDRISPQDARMVAPVADHWNGSGWSARVLPGRQSNLLGVYAAGRSNVWAVGFYIIALDNTVPVIDHFNGKAWLTVPSPRIGYGVLSGVAGTSGRSIWAIGRKLGRPAVTIIEHYNGRTWARVPGPSPARADYIDFGAIKVLSDHDVWVAGDYVRTDGVFRTLIEHFDGHAWRIVPSPNLGTGSNYLSGIAALGAHRIWAVGKVQDGPRFRPLGLLWNGHTWKARVLPAIGSGDNSLNGLTAAPGGVLWAVGSAAGPGGALRTLTERYQAGHWRIVASPSPGTADNALYAATVTGAHAVWAVGGWYSGSRGKTIALRRCQP
ncbi:MAG TPA: hypothetical protein VF834_22605 [Streptosporangiaceae bacterium]